MSEERTNSYTSLYPLDDIYVVIKKGETRERIYVKKTGECYKPLFYHRPIEENETHHFQEKDFIAKQSLEELIQQQHLEILLYDANMKRKTMVSQEFIKYIENIMREKSRLDDSEKAMIHRNSCYIACLVSDLLGINYPVSRASKLPLKEDISYQIKTVAVPASKQKAFITHLQVFCEISLYAERSITLTKVRDGIGDYRIVRSLKKAGIKATPNLYSSSFSLVSSQTRLDVERNYVKTGREEQSKTKTF